jgi:hypothetical protein
MTAVGVWLLLSSVPTCGFDAGASEPEGALPPPQDSRLTANMMAAIRLANNVVGIIANCSSFERNIDQRITHFMDPTAALQYLLKTDLQKAGRETLYRCLIATVTPLKA